MVFVMVNIDSKIALLDKISMWHECLRKENLGGEIWYVLGDFNSVCSTNERIRGRWFF